jgi:hypothetical protein
MSTQETALVQFGKYKGQPLAVLAQDPSYCDWLKEQAWVVHATPSCTR